MGTGRQDSSPTTDLGEDALQLERQVCFALVVASRSVLAIYRPLLEPLGLTHPQYLVMLALWGETPLSVGRIGALLQLDSPTLSPLLKRLQSAGLITRTRSGDDERQVDINLTDDGRALVSQAAACFETDVLTMLNRLPSRDRDALSRLVSRLLAAHAAEQGIDLFPAADE